MGGWLEPILRFAHYALLLGLFGWTAFRLIGLRKLIGISQERGGPWLSISAIAAPFISIMLMLVPIAAMMGVPLTALDWPMTEAMIFGTDMGRAFVVRISFLALGLSALMCLGRTERALPIASLSYLAALITLGWSGHAAATEGAIGLFHRLNNGVHMVAAGLWIGAIAWFLLLTVKAHRQHNDVFAHALLSALHRFAPMGVALIALVTVTGLINSQMIFGLANSAAVLGTDYGLLLLVKIVLVGGMLAFGARNAVVARHLAKSDDCGRIEADMALSAIRRSLTGEFTLAALVIGLVAIFGMMSPTPM